MFSMFQCVTAKSIPPAATPNVPSLADPKKVLMCVCVSNTVRAGHHEQSFRFSSLFPGHRCSTGQSQRPRFLQFFSQV